MRLLIVKPMEEATEGPMGITRTARAASYHRPLRPEALQSAQQLSKEKRAWGAKARIAS